MINKFRIFERIDPDSDEIMGLPSGECITMPDDILNRLYIKGLLQYNDKYEMLCFNDKDYYTIISFSSSFDKKQRIKNFLSEIGVRNYNINEKLKVDTWQSVKIRKKMSKLPIEFDCIIGDFDISDCGLESLYGCPDYIEGNFICVDNNLLDLKNGPTTVSGNYDVKKSGLYSLVGAPDYIKRDFDCSYNYINDLRGAPRIVDGSFYCSNCLLESLEGAPDILKNNFDCSYNNLESLKDGPDMISGIYDCSFNKLISVKESPNSVGTFKYIGNDKLMNINLSDFPFCDKLIPDRK